MQELSDGRSGIVLLRTVRIEQLAASKHAEVLVHLTFSSEGTASCDWLLDVAKHALECVVAKMLRAYVDSQDKLAEYSKGHEQAVTQASPLLPSSMRSRSCSPPPTPFNEEKHVTSEMEHLLRSINSLHTATICLKRTAGAKLLHAWGLLDHELSVGSKAASQHALEAEAKQCHKFLAMITSLVCAHVRCVSSTSAAALCIQRMQCWLEAASHDVVDDKFIEELSVGVAAMKALHDDRTWRQGVVVRAKALKAGLQAGDGKAYRQAICTQMRPTIFDKPVTAAQKQWKVDIVAGDAEVSATRKKIAAKAATTKTEAISAVEAGGDEASNKAPGKEEAKTEEAQ